MRHFATACALILVCLLSAGGAAATGPVISEFVACNKASLLDADHDSSDWIEIHNPTSTAINLDGWYLTDDMNDPMKWQFPEVSLAPDGYLVVFASGKDRRDPAGQLHTNFALQTDGESVALVAAGRPDHRLRLSRLPAATGGHLVWIERQRRLRERDEFYCRRGPMPRR